MATFTMRLTSSPRPSTSSTLSINDMWDRFQMGRVDASTVQTTLTAWTSYVPIVANMVNLQTLRNCSILQNVGHTVGIGNPFLKSDASMATRNPIRPMPTFVAIAMRQGVLQPLQRFAIWSDGPNRWWQWVTVYFPSGIVHRTPSTRLVAFSASRDRALTLCASRWSKCKLGISVTHPTLVVHFAPATNFGWLFAFFNRAYFHNVSITDLAT
jgi:hypothetical protein